MKKLLVVLSALVVMAAACNEVNVTLDPRFTATDTVDIAVDTTARDFVSVRGVNGTIEVTGVPGATSITGTAVIRVQADSQAEADAHIFDVDVGISTEMLGMVSIFTRHLFVDAGGRNYIVDYVLEVPPGLKVRVTNVNGNCAIDSIAGEFVQISVTNGNASVMDISGSAFANVVNGNIKGNVTLTGLEFIELETVNGWIDLYIPRSTSAMLRADAFPGGVEVRNLDVLYFEKTRTHVYGRLGAGDGRIQLGVINGPIRMTGYGSQ